MSQAWMVDDDEEMSQALRMMLKLLGFELRIFNNARSAAQALMGERLPDLLFLDLNMPEVNGVDLLKFIRSRARWRRLPVLMISAETADITVDEIYVMGADAYLFKPVSLEELKEGIKKAYFRRKAAASTT